MAKRKAQKPAPKIKPFSIRLSLKPKEAEKIVKKVIFEYQGILAEKKAVTAGLQINDSVDFRLKMAQKIYDGKVDYTDFPFEDASNVAGIIIPSSVDGMRAQLLRAFNVDPPFKMVNEEDIETAKDGEKTLQKIVREEIPNAKDEFSSWFQNACLKGVGILKHYWKKEQVSSRKEVTYSSLPEFLEVHNEKENPAIVEKLKKNEEITLIERETKQIGHDVIEWISPENFLVRKNVKDVNKARFVGEVKEYTAEELLEQKFDNVGELLSDEEQEKAGVLNKSFKTVHCELITKIKNKPEKLFCVVEVEKKVLLLVERFPYNHGHSMYIPMFIQPNEGNFWRQGLYDKLQSVHETHKNIVDLILNSAYITFIPSFKAKKKGSFDPEDQKWYPGVVWYLDHMDDVVQWDVRPSQMPFSEWAATMKDYGYERSGISPYTQGTPMSSSESGKKVQTLLAAGGVRIEESLGYIRNALNELAFQIIEINKQMNKQSPFQSSAFSYVSALDFNNVTPEAILQRALLVMETESKNPMVQQNPDALREIHAEFLRAAGMGWEEKIDVLLPSTEELKRGQIELQKQALLEMMQGAAEGQVAPQGGQENMPPLGGV